MFDWRSLAILSLSVHTTACVASTSEVSEIAVTLKKESPVTLACRDSLESVYQQPGRLPRLTDSRKGDVVRCATGDAIDSDTLRVALSEAGFAVDVQTGVQLFRISYRTQRASGIADVSSALVIVPLHSRDGGQHRKRGKLRYDGPGPNNRDIQTSYAGSRSFRFDRGPKHSDDDARGPLIVYGHGTAPYRQDCGLSRRDPLTATFLGGPDLELRTVLALAAQGWPVIMPDYPGFVAGSPVTGYMFAEDEANAFLDATRAAKKLLDRTREQVVFVGHSQGGHAALAAQSFERRYGMAGELAGVVTFAPFWAPARAFGFILSPYSGFQTGDPTGQADYAINTAIEYFYTHAELSDGAGAGQSILRFDIDDLLDAPGTECNFFPAIPADAGKAGVELMQQGFEKVAECATLGGPACDDALAKTWSDRFAADRPKLDKRGAPVLMWQGAADRVVEVPVIAGCAVDKIREDLTGRGARATFELCADADGDHETVESRNAAHVVQWIKARTQGGPEPTAACGDQSLLVGLGCVIGNSDRL